MSLSLSLSCKRLFVAFTGLLAIGCTGEATTEIHVDKSNMISGGEQLISGRQSASIERLDPQGRVIGAIPLGQSSRRSSAEIIANHDAEKRRLLELVREKSVPAREGESKRLVAMALDMIQQPLSEGIGSVLRRHGLTVERQVEVSGGNKEETRTYVYRGRPVARARSIYNRGSAHTTFGEDLNSGQPSSKLMWPTEEIEYPADALDAVPFDHPEAASTEDIEMAIAGLIALENDLNAMLEQELAEQAEFEDWLNTQSSLTSHIRLLESGFLGAKLVSGAPGENCFTQGLEAASGLVLGIAGAVAGQRALNGYLAAATGLTLKGIGLSLVASAGYVAAGVAVYALYEAAQCRFNRRNQPTAGTQSAFLPQPTAMEMCQATSV